MQSRWNDAEASRCASPLELRVYTSRLLGAEDSLVLSGGGNTSVKTREANIFGEPEDVLYVKGSGWDLATIEAAGFAPVRLDVLRRMAELPELSDRDMVRVQRAATLDPAAPTPSVEAILHAIIPLRFVDHTHADSVVTLSNTPDGERRIRQLYGDRVLVVPWVMPGFLLARTVRELVRDADWARLEGIVLLHHGVFSFAEGARESYERMIALVTRAEACLEQSGAATPVQPVGSPPPLRAPDLLSLAELRGAVGRILGQPVVARLDRSPEAFRFASRPDLTDVATRGPLTPDHVIRTRPAPLVAAGEWVRAASEYGERYLEYFRRHARAGVRCLDLAPRWIVWPGQGFVTVGTTAREAAITGEIARHTARAVELGEQLGGWRPLGEAEVFEVEYWELEQAKLQSGRVRLELQGRVALVTGAANGIGRAVAETLHRQGAAVTGVDRNPETARLLEGEGRLGVVADVTDAEAVERAIGECVARFGGIDILVSNAGGFPETRRVEEIAASQWQASLALNLSSHLAVLQRAVPFLRLGFDPCVVIVGSKNVPAPGPGAAAYSVAKAGLTQLGRVAALELGKDGIRVNMVHPHLVLDTAAWTEEVVAARASQYGMTAEQYLRNNLLGVEITTRDVANAVLALVGPGFSKTTGAQIPIDGGSDRVV